MRADRAMSAADYGRARRLLMRRDPVLRTLIIRRGPCGLNAARRPDPFTAIVEAIVWQQLSTRAAATIFGRFCALFPDGSPCPAQLGRIPDEGLRAAGLSRGKISYLRDLCRRMDEGSLPLGELEEMSDEDVVRVMTRVKGIGRWSAEMFLMFRLQRPDVLPVGDLGIVRAVQRVYGLRRPPPPARLLRMGEAWRPYRSVASWYLWASLDSTPFPVP